MTKMEEKKNDKKKGSIRKDENNEGEESASS
jgi:hypothetical protein